MRIGILTSFKECCTKEDYIIAKSFAEDGHKVDLLDFPIQFEFKNVYDLLILKNVWDLNENTYKNYFNELEKFLNKVTESNCKIVSSLDGKFNFNKYGKKYLAELYKKGYNVVPTINNVEDINILPVVEKYIKKPYVSYDGFDMQQITYNDLGTLTLKDEVLQPKIKFISEVQLYFVDNRFQYALEYTPSKWPEYPTPHELVPDQKFIDQAVEVINLNKASCSFNRVDFLRLSEDEIIILEFADYNPNLSLPLLCKETLNKFLKNFKHAVYKYTDNK